MNHRPSVVDRCFRSPIIEETIERVQERIRDPQLRSLFVNCFPNTLDTTVTYALDEDGRPDTFVVTGDIDAMWLRDSTNQVWPYLRFVNEDETLDRLIQGVINRQARCVLADPYGNAFNREPRTSDWVTDMTAMTDALHERKYELDSLCAVIRLSYGYYDVSKAPVCFDGRWHEAMQRIVTTIRNEQAGSDEVQEDGYRFQRVSPSPTETLAGGGYGQPAKKCGLSKSPFRPSDDSALLPFLIPANAMAVVCLRHLAELWSGPCPHPEDAASARALAAEIENGIRTVGVIQHPQHGEIFAYEVDGFGSYYCMDDANVPSLLSLPYLGYCRHDDPIYRRTREFVLSPSNPYYASGRAGQGIGSPHTGLGTIWPIAVTMQALTSQSEDEIRACLIQLRDTDADTGFIHEAYWKDDPARYSRSWFAWANTLFGELLLNLETDRPGFLASF